MQIQVNTDNHIKGSEKLSQHVNDVVGGALERFGAQITRVEVQLTDQNSSAKGGGDDKRCRLEARLAGMQPMSVTGEGSTVEQALAKAADKIEKALEKKLGKMEHRKGRPALRDEAELMGEGNDEEE